MKFSGNIRDVSLLKPDYMGFIFFHGSARFIGEPPFSTFDAIPSSIVKTAVFVDENVEKIISTCRLYGFTAVQLHGSESPDDCLKVQEAGLTVIKAFVVDKTLPETKVYENSTDFFLFDTSRGTGLKFDWKIIENYDGTTPFFLSGGIGADDVEAISKIQHPCFYGIDVNSRFETEPGRKDVTKTANFIKQIKI